MKKLTCMGLSLALMAGLLAGCGPMGPPPSPHQHPRRQLHPCPIPDHHPQRHREHRRLHLHGERGHALAEAFLWSRTPDVTVNYPALAPAPASRPPSTALWTWDWPPVP